MDHRPGRTLVLARAGLLTAVAMLTGTAAHVSADGLLPGAVGLGLVAGLTLLVVTRLLLRPASALRVVALTVGAQTGIHVLLTATAGHAGPAGGHGGGAAAGLAGAGPEAVGGAAVALSPLRVDDAGRRIGSLVDHAGAGATIGIDGGDGLALPAPVVHVLADLTGDHAPMMLVHLLAAALVGLWLAAGERALWTLVALARRAVVPPLASPVPPPAPGRPDPRFVDEPCRRTTTLLARVADRRGPPALLAA